MRAARASCAKSTVAPLLLVLSSPAPHRRNQNLQGCRFYIDLDGCGCTQPGVNPFEERLRREIGETPLNVCQGASQMVTLGLSPRPGSPITTTTTTTPHLPDALGGVVLDALDATCTHAVLRHRQQAALRDVPPGALVVAAEYVTAGSEEGRTAAPDAVREGRRRRAGRTKLSCLNPISIHCDYFPFTDAFTPFHTKQSNFPPYPGPAIPSMKGCEISLTNIKVGARSAEPGSQT